MTARDFLDGEKSCEPSEAVIRDALIEGVKIDARGRMRHDPRVWYEALEDALDKLLPAFWVAARTARGEQHD